MKRTLTAKLLVALVLLCSVAFASAQKFKTEQKTDANGYRYEYVTNDPTETRIYTLKNGLTVYLKVNKDEPRIQTYIVVKAGSKFDPKETTGLAHYLEHMMFKGSSRIASSDWAKEKPLLQQIFDLYEEHKKTNDPEKKKEIYARIDSVSGEASKYAIANEYDKLVASIGAKGTNANTSNERTLYINDIPSNELERWLRIELERFTDLQLRLFHTELETVYEEFNMYQDMDDVKAYYKLMELLFPTHQYGTQSTIGKAEHLKNPSMYNIMNYYHQYYVPNNMAICLSGDLDFDNTIKLIDKYYGNIKPVNTPKYVPPVEKPMEKPIEYSVYGPKSENVMLAFRTVGATHKDEKLVTLLSAILSNSQAGLIDLDLVQQQKVLSAGSGTEIMNDYGMHYLYAEPKDANQKLEDLRDLLLAELEKVKKGEFEDWLLKAIITDFRINFMRTFESNRVANLFFESYVTGQKWEEVLAYLDELEKVTKQDIIDFAKKNYGNNYVAIYKRTGQDPSIVKVDKPKITSVSLNREGQSEFMKEFQTWKTGKLEPVFLDYNRDIKKEMIKKDVELNYIKKVGNELFQLNYIVDMGERNNKKLALAIDYLQFLGTSKFAPAELQKEFYKYGLSFSVSAGDNRSYISISGLDQYLDKAIEMMEHVISSAVANKEAYNEYVGRILKSRADAKQDKDRILWDGMFNYAIYGKSNPFTDILSEKELLSINPEELVSLVKQMCSYKHRIFYYGPSDMATIAAKLKKNHATPDKMLSIPQEKRYEEQPTSKNTVYLVDYDMVQSNVIFVSLDDKFNKSYIPFSRLFGEYFGGGLSSIVFQEIREAKGLAYSAFAGFTTPEKPYERHRTFAFVGTQSDKLKIATDAMISLMNDMPMAEKQFNGAKDGILKKIDSERITKASIFWNYLSNQDRGIDYDIRRDVYDYAKKTNIGEFRSFFDKHIKGKNYTFVVIGKKSTIDMKVLGELGEIKELSLEELFGY